MTANKLQLWQDIREKKPWSFSRYPCTVKETTLKTGDYAIVGDCSYTENNEFRPAFAVERKSENDFLNSITHDRDRFERELERADSFEHRMPVIVEQTFEHFMDGRHFQNVSPNAIKGTVNAHVNMFNTEYYFTRDRQRAAQLAFDFLQWRDEERTS
jgi:ERCC4-type nuclease